MHGGAMLAQTLVGAGSAARGSELGPTLSNVCRPKFITQECTTHAHYTFSYYHKSIATFSLPSLGDAPLVFFFFFFTCMPDLESGYSFFGDK